MYPKHFLLTVAVVLGFCAGATTTQAAPINVTYAVDTTVSGNPTNPPLIGDGTGSLDPFGSMIWRDEAFPDLATGAVTGTFTLTFSDGGTLFGTLSEQLNLAAAPIVPFTQILTVAGGTGAFLGYYGTLTGSGNLNLASLSSSASGTGTLQTVPEPESVVLLGMGVACLLAHRKRPDRSRVPSTWSA